jgi:hypothetical protein
MKLKYIIITCCLYLAAASVVFAEYYEYTDKNGVKYFTDDVSEIPKDQRPGLNVYKSIEPPPDEEVAAPVEEVEEKKGPSTYDTLMEGKGTLDAEYQGLTKLRDDLTKKEETTDKKEYNKLITDFNMKIKEHQEKRKAYEEKVRLYNESLSSPEQK